MNRQLAFLQGDPLQVHDDAFSYLVERGPIGLIGFVGLWVGPVAMRPSARAWPG